MEHYPATFAGATLEPTGVTDVYAVAASDAKLVSAVNALKHARLPGHSGAVERSYSQLMSISAKLSGRIRICRRRGSISSQFGPIRRRGQSRLPC